MHIPIVTRRELLVGSTATLCTAAMKPRSSDAFSPERFNFLVVGDWGRDGKHYQCHVARQMAVEAQRINARFVVSTGDNFYNLGVSSVTDSQWDTSFYNIYCDPPLLGLKWYPVLGNHDYGGKVRAQVDRSERCDRWCMEGQRYVKWGRDLGHKDLDLFLLDTVAWQGKENFPFMLFGSNVAKDDPRKHCDWLAEKLGASTAKFTLAFGHHPIYSIGPHGGKAKMLDLDRMLREHGVAAYICGHDHCLSHITDCGMNYVCSGGGSKELQTFTGDPKVHGCVLRGHCPPLREEAAVPGYPRWHSVVDRAGFASFSLGEDELSFRLIDRFGVVCHEGRILAPGANTICLRPEDAAAGA